MDLIDRIAEHGATDELKYIDVPEWGKDGKPERIYYKPLTLKDMDTLASMASSPSEAGTSYARTVVLKALDKEGRRLFKLVDAVVLAEKADWQVIRRIANAMSASGPKDEAEAEKN